MFDLIGYLERHKEWSERTFGTHDRLQGLAQHLLKEAAEVAVEPSDAEEWVDSIIIAFDALLNLGLGPSEITALLVAKQSKNFQRVWPKGVSDDSPVEHVRDERLIEIDRLLKQRAEAHDACDQDEVTRLTGLIEGLKKEATDGALDQA